jgi:two-component system, NtrC family, sensor kinase
LKEAREQQAATAEILKVIASSPSDVQPVFEAIAASANRLIGGFSCTVVRFIDGMAHLKAFTSLSRSSRAALKSIAIHQMPPWGLTEISRSKKSYAC